MTDMELDPLRDKMVAALYGELPAEEEEELLTHVAGNAELRAEWEELQEARGFLQEADAADTEPGFAFEMPETRTTGTGVLDRLREFVGGRSLRPAFGFALATAAFVILLAAGLRIDQADGGLVVRFGPPPAPGPDLAAIARHTGEPGVPIDAITPVSDEQPGRQVVQVGSDLSAPVTRAELAAFAQELMTAVDTRIEEKDTRRMGQTVYLLRDYFGAIEEQRQRDRREINTELNRAFLTLARADMQSDRPLPPQEQEFPVTPAVNPQGQPEEERRHD